MKEPPGRRDLWLVVAGSSFGTLIEWYDFYIYAILVGILSRKFFPGSLSSSFLASLAALWVGFAVRPFGAGVFGHIGDVIGRKYTFLATLLLMGVSTFSVGLLPTFARIGYWAPAALVALRCAQGFALGGEYGGAATYVAEYAPEGRRAFYTSFIQSMATLGLLAALAVVLTVRFLVGDRALEEWGWRLPFFASLFLVAISLWIRSRLQESPVFRRMKKSGTSAKMPLREITGKQWRLMAIALFGAVAGQAVISYTSQIYQLYFMTRMLGISNGTGYLLAAAGIALGTPFYFFWAMVSDRYGRKPVLLSGCALAAVGYWPIYHGMAASVYRVQGAIIIRYAPMILMLALQMFLVTMVSSPILALLTEMFPANVRYTCMSIPYHVGNGEFGGLTPLLATSLAAWWFVRHPHDPQRIYFGLVWPIGIALMTLVVGWAFLPETNKNSIWDGAPPTKKSGQDEPAPVGSLPLRQEKL